MKRNPARSPRTPGVSAASRVPSLVAAVCLAGCTATPTRPPPTPQASVGYRAVESAGTRHYELADDEVATVPTPTAMAPPVYPEAMVALGIAHVDVRAQVIVDAAGHVGEVRIESRDDTRPVAFDEAVRTAVSQWRYQPLRFQHWEDVLDEQGNLVDSRLTGDDARPFSLEYEFSFDLRDGHASVRTNPAAAK